MKTDGPSESPAELHRVVADFIDEIVATIENSLVCRFEITNSYVKTAPKPIGSSGGRYKIAYDLAIWAKVRGHETYRLEVTYVLVWNQKSEFPAVNESSFKLYLGGGGEPLFHYDYLRDPKGHIPGAHLNVHHNREDLREALSQCGDRYRGKAKQKTIAGGGTVNDSELHYPVGGPRFRPALEDVLQFMIYELSVDAQPGWKRTIEGGRVRWRERQLRTAVADNLHVAAEVLRAHGFCVSGGPHADPNDRRITEL